LSLLTVYARPSQSTARVRRIFPAILGNTTHANVGADHHGGHSQVTVPHVPAGELRVRDPHVCRALNLGQHALVLAEPPDRPFKRLGRRPTQALLKQGFSVLGWRLIPPLDSTSQARACLDQCRWESLLIPRPW